MSKLLFVKNYEYKKIKPKKRKKKIETNIVYITRTYTNVRIRPPNWTNVNIRNYGFKRSKWPIKQNKRLHLKVFVFVFENQQIKQRRRRRSNQYSVNIKVYLR